MKKYKFDSNPQTTGKNNPENLQHDRAIEFTCRFHLYLIWFYVYLFSVTVQCVELRFYFKSADNAQ